MNGQSLNKQVVYDIFVDGFNSRLSRVHSGFADTVLRNFRLAIDSRDKMTT